MKRDIILNITTFSIFTLFIYTGVNKLISFDFTLKDLHRSPLLGNYAFFLAIAVPLAELITAAMLIIPKYQKYGFMAATILMFAFTVYVGYVLGFTVDKPCTCGGIIRELSWKNHFIFNIFFLLIAITGWILKHKKVANNYA